MRYLVDPQSLVFNSKRINGFVEFITDNDVKQWDLLSIATDVASEWTSDWTEGQGFGSSDMTYMLKDFIDNVIWKYTGGKFETKFTPSLSVVEYSEAEHHTMVQKMESGI